MKLQSFKNTGFEFFLSFVNGESVAVNLSSLIKNHVAEEHLNSARIDPEWGCLEFCNGSIDIEPTTLYHFAIKHSDHKLQHENT